MFVRLAGQQTELFSSAGMEHLIHKGLGSNTRQPQATRRPTMMSSMAFGIHTEIAGICGCNLLTKSNLRALRNGQNDNRNLICKKVCCNPMLNQRGKSTTHHCLLGAHSFECKRRHGRDLETRLDVPPRWCYHHDDGWVNRPSHDNVLVRSSLALRTKEKGTNLLITSPLLF